MEGIQVELRNLDIQLLDMDGVLCVWISGASLEQIQSNPELERTVRATVARLVEQNKTLGWEVKAADTSSVMSFDEIDRALRAFTSRSAREILDAIRACPASYPQMTKHQRQQVLFHLSLRSSIFEADQTTYEAAKASYNAVLDWENENAAHE
jgi:hypothetical protein